VIAERFGLNIESLPRSSVVLTATGRMRPALLRDVIIIFGTQNGRLHAEELDSIDVISLAEEAGFHGVLGMDVLDRFKWRKTGDSWFLEK
jgi:predicted aspartyl protease